jgi:hypothetical protein
MAGPNETGKPKTEDYNLGRGIVYFAPIDADGKPTIWRDLGNAPEFNISVEVETLEHQSSREGLKVVDKEVIISQEVSVGFQLDEINSENMALFFSGAKASHTNVSVAGFVEHEMVLDGNLELGRWYDLYNAASPPERAYDVDIADLTVKTNEAAPVTLVVDVDFELDAEMGRIFILSTGILVPTAIGTGDGLLVTLVANGAAKDVEEVRALIQTNVLGALKFISENPADNDRSQEYEFHKISIKPEGDFALIGDEFTVQGFTGAAEKNETQSPDSPTLTIRVVDLV